MTNSNVKISNVFICNSFPFPDKTITRLSLRCSNLIEDIVAYPTRYDNKIIFLTSLVQHFLIPHTLSTRYLRHRRVVVSQQCHRIASFLRLALTKISSTKYMGIKKRCTKFPARDNRKICPFDVSIFSQTIQITFSFF